MAPYFASQDPVAPSLTWSLSNDRGGPLARLDGLQIESGHLRWLGATNEWFISHRGQAAIYGNRRTDAPDLLEALASVGVTDDDTAATEAVRGEREEGTTQAE